MLEITSLICIVVLCVCNICCLQMVDLSQSMMDIAQQRLATCNVTLQPATLVADATSLPFPDASFDRYISNMTVHYAPDADAFLREAARILASGGLAGFSVWGQEHLSSAFTLLPRIKISLGLTPSSTSTSTSTSTPPPPRSSYHMGEDDEALRQQVLLAGFSSCVIWHAVSVVEATTAEQFADTMIEGSNSTKQEYLGWPEETQQRFREEVLRCATDILDRGEPLCLDVCYCIARK